MVCPWKQDYQDAKRVAVQLGIPFKMYDFETEYRGKVMDYMIAEYRAGRTPNPDIMCNQEVKFKLFLETALADGADMIATGHYARVSPGPEGQGAQLMTGVDANKDQSYFLYRVMSGALDKSLMPIGNLEKPAVRGLAKKFGLATAEKKDSQGICFVGKVGIKEFLQQFVPPDGPGMGPGAIVGTNGQTIGEHDGALFYTIGQRHGLSVGGGLPYYVIGKDMAKNEVYVTTDLQDPKLWTSRLTITSPHWINAAPTDDETAHDGGQFFVHTRYRAPLVKCSVKRLAHDENNRGENRWQIDMEEEVRALTPGQSAVIYEPAEDGHRVVGGGIVIQ